MGRNGGGLATLSTLLPRRHRNFLEHFKRQGSYQLVLCASRSCEMKRVPFVVSTETKNGVRVEPAPRLHVYRRLKSMRSAIEEENKDRYEVFDAGYLGLLRTRGRGGNRESAIAANAVLVGLLQADGTSDQTGEIGYVFHLWLNRAFASGLKVGRKLEREKQEQCRSKRRKNSQLARHTVFGDRMSQERHGGRGH